MIKVNIGGVDYTARYSLRALFLYEKMTGNNGFETKTTEDSFKFMYAMIKANNKDCELTWDDFIDAADADPKIIAMLSQGLADEVTKANDMSAPKKGKETKKK
jgi:hypothetical protein